MKRNTRINNNYNWFPQYQRVEVDLPSTHIDGYGNPAPIIASCFVRESPLCPPAQLVVYVWIFNHRAECYPATTQEGEQLIKDMQAVGPTTIFELVECFGLEWTD